MSGPNPTERLDNIRLAISFGHELDNDAAKQLERALAASERIGTDALGELARVSGERDALDDANTKLGDLLIDARTERDEAQAEAGRLREALFQAGDDIAERVASHGICKDDSPARCDRCRLLQDIQAALEPAPDPAGERQGG